MSKRYNPLSSHSVKTSREIYARLGLCYKHGLRNCELCSNAATCSICTLALAMRVCGECVFQQPIPVMLAVSVKQGAIPE